MNEPLVSIIIPSYNSLSFLEESIKSAIDQTYKNIEIILVDDGSTDGTKERFAHFESLGVKCIYQENAGASTARNTGLDAAKGEYIQFLDADDIIHPQKIEKQINKMITEGAELSYTYWINFKKSIDENKNTKFIFEHFDHSKIKTGKDLLMSYGLDNWFILTSVWMVSKKLINRSGYWNTNISNNDDGEYFTRILLKTDRVVAVEEVLTFYRLNDDSLGSLNSKEKAISAYNSWRLILSHIKNDGENKLLIYPKRGIFFLYIYIRKRYPKVSQLLYKELINMDKYEPSYNFIQDIWLYRCVKLMGIKFGFKLFSLLQFIRYFPYYKKHSSY